MLSFQSLGAVSLRLWDFELLNEGIFSAEIISTNLLRHIEMILDHHVVDFRHLRNLIMMHQIDWIEIPTMN